LRNIELKTRLRDVAAARQTAAAIATGRLGTQHQIDTFFHCRRDRLKLREIQGQPAHKRKPRLRPARGEALVLEDTTSAPIFLQMRMIDSFRAE
jgi:hypothetical protein